MGRLAGKLRNLGLEHSLVSRVEEVVRRRNHVVHHLLKEPATLRAVFKGEGMAEVVTDLEELASEIRSVGDAIARPAFAGMDALLPLPVTEAIEKIQALDIQEEDPAPLKELAAFAEFVDPEALRALLESEEAEPGDK